MRPSLHRRPWLDPLIALAAAGAAAAGIALGPATDQPVLQWSLIEAAALTLAFARRLPVVGLALCVVLTAVIGVVLPDISQVAPLTSGFLLGVVAYRHGTAVTVPAWAVTFIAVVAGMGQDYDRLLDGADGVLMLVATALAVAAPAAFGRYLAVLRQAAVVAEERVREAEERRLVETRAARMAERAHLAGDLHDLVAHHVSAIALTAGSAHYAATHAPDERQRLDAALEGITTIQTAARQTLVDLRGLLHVLRDPGTPDVLADPEQMITDAVERSRTAGLRVTLTHDDRAGQAPLALRVTTARVLQEALTNALKHGGPGSDVAATVAVRDDRILIDVTNTLRLAPAVPLPASGHGLSGMRERVEVLGGTLVAGPAPDGWHLAAALPLAVRP
ncbi:signal transduction histidine kinase-like protein [Streptomyces zinciresistens K42]|uniref:histidine kinase n=1 Tax=Streptomyces zinciresistens K42 TaxID=700597 RepID=G2GNT9_9ACTN|nr:histidine kinase [Streptomyces zinciresistens]EGX54828.1 signal transduction histidine kinase-like protein [Streptomyces zinciresistens K42]